MKVLFLTGAGISARAGIPTYRDTGSSWRDKDLEEKSHANRYGNHLDELWNKHWGPLSLQMKLAKPTDAHKAIAEFEKDHEVITATQNIDQLHERAGSNNVAHLHGAMDAYCMRCKSRDIRPWEKDAPQCFGCGSRKTRPDVVLFGENLNKKMFDGLTAFAEQADYIISVGTSLNVSPANYLFYDNASRAIFVNKEMVPMAKWAKQTHIGLADDMLGGVLNDLSAKA